MPSDLQSRLDAVCDEQTLIAFVAALAADREDEVAKEKVSPSSPCGPGVNGWENGTIEAFLDAAATWATASRNGLQFYRNPDNPWKRCADIIYMGKIYE
jgi:hypothetical protein